eukprot:9435582-Pyramimonas_sp.AAC.1
MVTYALRVTYNLFEWAASLEEAYLCASASGQFLALFVSWWCVATVGAARILSGTNFVSIVAATCRTYSRPTRSSPSAPG